MSEVQNPLKEVGVKILEDWAMMLVDELSDGIQAFDQSEQLFESAVKVRGTVNGTVIIVAQKPFIDGLIKNLLGDEDEHEQNICEDAFKEMGNVLAGNFITAAYGSDIVFELRSPEFSEISTSDCQKSAEQKITYFFSADDEPVMFSFALD